MGKNKRHMMHWGKIFAMFKNDKCWNQQEKKVKNSNGKINTK